MLSRREWLRVTALSAAGAAGSLALSPRDLLAAPVPIDVYKTATCGCCKLWVTHMQTSGFAVTVHDVSSIDSVNAARGIPLALQACHAATVGRFIIVGHVPPELVLRVLKEEPAGVLGLAVPGMPLGSPGMEATKREPYSVLTWDKTGATHVYAKR